jgi:hypothetical protein
LLIRETAPSPSSIGGFTPALTAKMQRSSLTAPPLDVDMETLDHELLAKLAGRWGLTGQLDAWRARAKAADFGQEPAPSEATLARPTQQALDAAAAARARVLVRRVP